MILVNFGVQNPNLGGIQSVEGPFGKYWDKFVHAPQKSVKYQINNLNNLVAKKLPQIERRGDKWIILVNFEVQNINLSVVL